MDVNTFTPSTSDRNRCMNGQAKSDKNTYLKGFLRIKPNPCMLINDRFLKYMDSM